MGKRNKFYLFTLILSLLFTLSCTKKATKISTSGSKPTTTTGKFEFRAIPRGVKVGESVLYFVIGGVRPLRFYATYGIIDGKGMYTAPQTTGIGQIDVIDARNNRISAVIYVYSPLLINPTSLTLVKNKGQIFTASGGVPPYSFRANIGTIDPNTGSYFGSTKVGEEIITVYDSMGNKTTSTVTINPDLTINPTSLSMTPRGTATFTILGGIPPYSFSASLGTINSSGFYTSPSSIGNDFVTVRDSLGNSAISSIGIYAGLGINPSRINLQINSSTTFVATGGDPPYIYTASLGNINSSTGLYTAPSTSGTAIIGVSDKFGKKETSEVNIFSPLKVSPMEITLAVGNTHKIEASEGVPPYKFSTNIGSISASGFFTAPNIASTGRVTVTDQQNNNIVVNVTINSKLEINPPTFALSVDSISNFFGYFGVPPYTYSALIGTIGQDGSYTAPSEPGDETITVMDSLGNQATSVGTIEALALASKLSFTDSSKSMRPGESYSFTVTGGTPPYTFAANLGAIDSFGLYRFPEGIKEDVAQVTDSKGETATINIIGDFKNLWTWMSGTNSLNHPGVYGEESGNLPGGKIGSVSWIDAEGNFWLFGGASGPEYFFNDLWIYNLNSDQWNLVNIQNTNLNHPGIYGVLGNSSPDNIPGGRYFANSWTDKNGKFWLFGGGGYGGPSSASIGFNDLWKYDPSIQQWTWMSGNNQSNQPGVYGTKGAPSSTNKPGARHSSMSWTDSSGNLWLLGGWGKAPDGRLNDLWKYNISTKYWTWVSGSSSVDQIGKYGTKGTPSINNSPGGRQNALSWIDSSGNLWLFGGRGFGKASLGYLNDLWKFNPSNSEWTWVSGSDSPNQAGIYGNIGEASPNNIPGARQTSISWSDPSGNLWLFGGLDPNSSSYFNDLWKFNVTDKNWTWVSGGKLPNQTGVYGDMGVTSQNKVPGGRESEISWYDSAGNLWLFGGFGYGTSGKGFLNDLWKFIPK
ncbi:MAG: kelch repeat-containing protein [Bacteriovoracales bacterium]